MRYFQKKNMYLTVFAAGFFILGCVTVNIYFPAEKVESVADQIVNDVRGDKGEDLPDNDQSLRTGKSFIAFLSSTAWAEEKAVSVSNPTIRALKADMKSRFQKLKPHYQKDRIQEKDDGFLSLESTKGLGLKEERDLKNLVAAENKDRERLYTEVTKAMKIEPSQRSKVAAIFAEKWQESVP